MKRFQDDNVDTNGEDTPGSILDKLSGKPFFKAPEGYFDKLPLKVQERIHSKQERPLMELIKLLARPAVSIPALLLVFLAGYFSLNYLQQDNDKKIAQINKPVQTKEKPVVPDSSSSIIEEKPGTEGQPVIKENERELPPVYTAAVFELTEEEELLIAAIPVSDKVDYLLDHDIDINLVMEEL